MRSIRQTEIYQNKFMEKNIQNTEILIDIFGKFPSFHDAEVVQVAIKRKDSGEYCPTFNALIKINNHNSGDDFLVDLKFKSIFGLKLENFNHQNILGDLEIREFSDKYFEELKSDDRLLGVVGNQEIERLNLYVKFYYCFGIEAEFLCQSVSIESVKVLSKEEKKIL